MTDSKFMEMATTHVANLFNEDTKLVKEFGKIDPDEVVVVWFCKTLQNWKGVFRVNRPHDGLLYEITWNGDDSEGIAVIYEKKDKQYFIE